MECSVIDEPVARKPSVFISHTTRDRRDSHLAHVLARGLRARGAQVWIAPESVPAGEEWREEIASGVMDRCSHFLVIISTASVAAPWVLEEISLARKRRENDGAFSVLPLLVGEVPHYRNRRFLDAFQHITYHDDPVAELEAVALAVGLRPNVPDAISAIVEDKTRDFVGRDYIFAAVDEFIRTNPNGYITIEGDPGIGKSAILARFVQRTGCIAYFNVRAQGISTARQFLESVCAQIIDRFGLDYPSLPTDAARSGAFLARLLDEAATQLADSERLVIAVDALDEVDPVTTPGNILFLPPYLPDAVYFVLTRRQIHVPMTVDTPQQVIDLMGYRAEGMSDVRDFVRRAVATRAGLRAWSERYGLGPEEFVDHIATLSEGNFMYVRYVLPDVEKGLYADLEIHQLPIGLKGYYEDHWRRMGMTAKPLPHTRIRIVYVLSEARRPVSRRLIARLARDDTSEISELAVQEVLDDWDEFLREESGADGVLYSIYHASFRDFLNRLDIVQAAGVTTREINALIADNIAKDLFGDDEPS
jgi:hypothetical protein